MPGVIERGDLRLGVCAAFILEQHIVRTVGIERGVEVNQVHALAGDVVAEDREVVAVKEGVGGHGLSLNEKPSFFPESGSFLLEKSP
jgi:hypothetical protein